MTSRYAVEQASEGANSHRKKRKWKCPDVDMSVTRSSAVKLEDLQSDCAHLAAAPSTERQVCWPVFSVPWRFHECQVLLSLFGVKVPSLRRSSGTRNARTQRREANTVRAPPLIRTTAAPAPAYARPRPRPRHRAAVCQRFVRIINCTVFGASAAAGASTLGDMTATGLNSPWRLLTKESTLQSVSTPMSLRHLVPQNSPGGEAVALPPATLAWCRKSCGMTAFQVNTSL